MSPNAPTPRNLWGTCCPDDPQCEHSFMSTNDLSTHMDTPVVAAADLVDRAGATEFQIAWDCPHTPDETGDHTCPDVRWTCSAKYKGHRIFTEPRQHPAQAANALAVKILTGATCRCGELVGLFGAPGCQWTLKGNRWEPSCDARPINMTGLGVERGDLVGMNRAARRRMNRKKKR